MLAAGYNVANVGSSMMVERLIKHDAGLNLKNKVGQTALMIAAKSRSIFSSVNFDIAKKLVRAKSNLDLQDNYGWTALMYATKIS